MNNETIKGFIVELRDKILLPMKENKAVQVTRFQLDFYILAIESLLNDKDGE